MLYTSKGGYETPHHLAETLKRETLKPNGQTFRLLLSQSIIFQFRFHKLFGKILIVSMLRNEHLSISLKSQISVAKKVTIQLTTPLL